MSQVQLALSATAEGHDKDNLLSLQSDIQELISLTKESLKSAEGKDTSENEDDGLSDSEEDNEDDAMAAEYAMFKVLNISHEYSIKNLILQQLIAILFCLFIIFS